MDFQIDATADGTRLKFLYLTDEHSLSAWPHPCREPLKGHECCGGADEAHQTLSSIGVHPIGQWAGVPCPGSTRLERGQQRHQHGQHRAVVPVGARLCGVVEWTIPG
jgi:hypothetical protein